MRRQYTKYQTETNGMETHTHTHTHTQDGGGASNEVSEERVL